MNKVFADTGWEDDLYWQTEDRKTNKKVNQLINDITRYSRTISTLLLRLETKFSWSPFEGHGKPEPLKYDLAGKWSRRITDENRLVYQVEGNHLIVYICRYHY